MPSEEGTAWCSSYFQSGLPHLLPHPVLHPPLGFLHLPPHPHFQPPLLHPSLSSFHCHARVGEKKNSVKTQLESPVFLHWKIPSWNKLFLGPVLHLSIQKARGQLSLHSSIVSRIHPQQKLPTAWECDGQRVEDLLWMDTKVETQDRKTISKQKM